MGGGGGPASAAPRACGACSTTQVGGQIAWLLPLAAISLRRRPVADAARAADRPARAPAFVLFGVWALVHVAVFSSQQGIFHPYYVSALAPAVAALCGVGVVTLWRLGPPLVGRRRGARRDDRWRRRGSR